MAAATPDEMKAARTTPGWSRWLMITALVAGVFLVYWNSLPAPFLFDDTGAVMNNPTIRHLASWAVFDPPADGTTTTGRPVVNLSFAVNYALGGETAWGYRAFNGVIHALAALALLGIMRRTLTGPVLGDRFGLAAQPLAFFTALLWAVHPLQTESVTCIAQRTESLCGLFYFLTLYAFIRGTVAPGLLASRHRWFVLSIFACLLGMGTKEVMVTAPVMVLLYDRTFVAGTFSVAWRRRWPWHLALAGTWLWLAWLVISGGGARGASAGFGFGISWWHYLLKQCEALVLYLKLSFWPHPLVLDYGTAVVKSARDVWAQGIAVLALLAVTAWALWRKPALGFAGAWFFVILAPSSSVVPLVGQTMAEHRMYLPLAGIVGLLVPVLYHGAGRSILWVLAAVAVAFGAMTVARNHDYLDTRQIWADTVAKYPQNARAHNNLAWALQLQGKSDEANAHFARAIELQPGYVSAHYNWGVALLDQKRTPEAITQLEIAVRLAPTHADGFVNLGNALMQEQRPAEAVTCYEQALRLRPGSDVDYDLGVALMEVGRNDEAAGHFQAALRSDPNLPEAYYQLGRLHELAGDLTAAEKNYAEALRQAPDHAAAHGKLGLLLARVGQLVPATEHFRAAVQVRPDDADARANLGNALLLQGQVKEAVACYEEALRLRPGDARLRENLQIAREALR